jgi:spore coat protein A
MDRKSKLTISRRNFIKTGLLAGAGFLTPGLRGARTISARASAGTPGTLGNLVLPQIVAQTPLPGSAIPQFVDALPGLDVIVAGTSLITLRSAEFLAPMMPTAFVPAVGTYAGTYVWGYLQPGQTTRASHIGPVIVATRGTPTEIKWVNELGNADPYGTGGSQVLAYTQSTDQTLHWADPLHQDMPNMCAHQGVGSAAYCGEYYTGPIPDVTHVHGGEVPAEIDGGPDAWYTSDGTYHGAAYYAGLGGGGNSVVFRYPNSQEAASIWFHPHPLGVTRLNVYAGLAGAYLITDPLNPPPANLPGPADIIPLVIQDRSFDVNGQLYFPNVGINPEHPFWIPEFVGDTIVVNGKTWPFLNVERKRYRFLFLNGSNARTYEMFLVDPVTKVMGPPMWVVGTDGGYLDTPVKIDPNVKPNDKLVVMPGERYDVIVDFNDPTWLAANPNFSGTLILRNTGRTPYPKGASPQGSTLGQIVQFRVGAAPVGGDSSYNPDPLTGGGQALRQPMIRLADPVAGTLAAGVTADRTRQLTLNEVMGPGGPLEVLVNNTKWDGKRPDGTPLPGSTPDGFGNYLTELPQEGSTEVWEIVNLTADAHPIHLHLVQFQLINRQNFNTNKYNGVYNAAFTGGVFVGAYGPPYNYDNSNNPDFATQTTPPTVGGNPNVTLYLQGPVRPPLPQEAGWKDTVIMYPGQVTRIAVRWAPTDLGLGLDPSQYAYPFDPTGGDYVWHCHILDHEDNEMMRPDKLTPNGAATRTYIKGTDY